VEGSQDYGCFSWAPGFHEKGSYVVTKRDLIEEVALQYPRFSRRDAEVMVNAVFDSMTDALAKGERIEIRGFGSFIVKQRSAREGRNPRTGEIVAVAAKKVPLFKVGKELRLRVDGQPVSEEDMERDNGDDYGDE
jgi:integration host factor subunit beta